jgi:hypothetical protein
MELLPYGSALGPCFMIDNSWNKLIFDHRIQQSTYAETPLLNLLGHVPHLPIRFDLHHSIVNGDLVKLGFLFVAEECVGLPRHCLLVVAESNDLQLVVGRSPLESGVLPGLSQVDVHLVVLTTRVKQVRALL